MGNGDMETGEIIKTLKMRLAAGARLLGPLRLHGERAWKILASNPLADRISPPTCLCLSLETEKIVAFAAQRSAAHYKVLSCKTYPVTGKAFPAPDDVASIFDIAQTEFGLQGDEVLLCFPKQLVIFQRVELPAAVLPNLAQVVDYEFDRFLPFGAGDAAFDYAADYSSSEDTVQLSLAVCRAQTVQEYLAAITEAGGRVRGIAFDISALASLARLDAGCETFLFVHISNDSVAGGHVDAGILKTVFSKGIAEADELAGVLQAFVESVASDHSRIPFFVSFGEDTAALREQLVHLRAVPVEVIDGIAPPFSADPGRGSRIAAAAVYECLSPEARGFNLLARGIHEPDRPSFLVSWILAAVILVLVGIYAAMPVKIEEQRLKEIERQIALRRDQVRAAEAIIKEIEAINKEQSLIEGFKQEKPLMIDLLRELTNIIPKNAWLSRVKIAGNQINLEGYSPSASGLVEILEASPYFQKVEFSSPTFRDARLNMDRFQIKMELKGTVTGGKSNEAK